MDIVTFEIVCFLAAVLLVTVLIIAFTYWMRRDRKKRARELAETQDQSQTPR